MATTNLPRISVSVKRTDALPDIAQWKNRFGIHSETSDRIYIISQNINKGHMGCSCPGWKRYRTCKHLSSLGLPGHETPVTLNLNFR